MWSALADVVVLIHVLFVAFVVAGGVLVLYRPRLAWLHLPAVAWGAFVEFSWRICPLTPLENELRQRGGGPTYEASFVEHAVMPALYPVGLTREAQSWLGVVAIFINVVVYPLAFGRSRNRGTGR